MTWTILAISRQVRWDPSPKHLYHLAVGNKLANRGHFGKLASGKRTLTKGSWLPMNAMTSMCPFPTRHTRFIQQHKHDWSSPDTVSSRLAELPRKNNNDNKKRLKECDKNLAETQVRLSSFNPRKRKVHITPEVGETIVYFRFLPNGLFALLGTKNLLFKIQVLCCQERGEHLLLVVCFYLVPMISVLFGKKIWFNIQTACRNLKFWSDKILRYFYYEKMIYYIISFDLKYVTRVHKMTQRVKECSTKPEYT